VVQFKESFLANVFGCRPLSKKVIKTPIHQYIVTLEQGLEFSRRDGYPSLAAPAITITPAKRFL
jgi:hypothetical protein